MGKWFKEIVDELIFESKDNLHSKASWWLILSKAYYVQGLTLVPDSVFDSLNRSLLERYDELKHPHKHLITRECLEAYSGFSIKEKDYPSIVSNCLIDIVDKYQIEKEEK